MLYDIIEDAVTTEKQNSHQQGVSPMYSNLTYFRESYQRFALKNIFDSYTFLINLFDFLLLAHAIYLEKQNLLHEIK